MNVTIHFVVHNAPLREETIHIEGGAGAAEVVTVRPLSHGRHKVALVTYDHCKVNTNLNRAENGTNVSAVYVEKSFMNITHDTGRSPRPTGLRVITTGSAFNVSPTPGNQALALASKK